MLIIVIMACSKSAGMKSARKMGGPESQLFKKVSALHENLPDWAKKIWNFYIKGRQTGEMESEMEWKRVKNKSSFSYVFPQVSNILLSSNGRAYAQEITRLQKEMQSEMKSRNRPSKLPIFTSINHFFTFSPGFYFPQNKTEHMLCEMPLQAIIFLLPIVYVFELKWFESERITITGPCLAFVWYHQQSFGDGIRPIITKQIPLDGEVRASRKTIWIFRSYSFPRLTLRSIMRVRKQQLGRRMAFTEHYLWCKSSSEYTPSKRTIPDVRGEMRRPATLKCIGIVTFIFGLCSNTFFSLLLLPSQLIIGRPDLSSDLLWERPDSTSIWICFEFWTRIDPPSELLHSLQRSINYTLPAATVRAYNSWRIPKARSATSSNFMPQLMADTSALYGM